jgi:glycosyltransferase involved in cell wall biosynthesis
LEAFASVHQAIPESTLMLVGGGEDLPRLKQRAAQLGLNHAVHFCGRAHPDQVVLYYHLADVSVDPVHDDDIARGRSPLKLFESWACGVPFVTGKVGDRELLLGDPPAGILVPPGDPQALAAGLLEVLTNPQLSKVLRARGQSRVQDYYWDQLITRLEPLYLV